MSLRHHDLSARVACFLRRHPPGQRLAIGYSGGLDSTVLLHLFAGLRGEFAFHLFAVHVHHGLSPQADAWAAHCRRQCADLEVPLRVERVEVHRAGQGLEAAAREARYRVFAALDVDALALAQQRDDQAETVLLQLLRGAGMKGLAAMPEARALGSLKLLRPLLDVPREEIEAYARARGWSWVDDESNADIALRRNAARHRLMPILEDLFPGAAVTLAQAAAQFAESAALLDVLARQDGAAAIGPEGLPVTRLKELDAARARNLLRHYLELRGIPVQRERLRVALEQMLDAREDAQPRVDFGVATLRRFQGHVVLVRLKSTPKPPQDRLGGCSAGASPARRRCYSTSLFQVNPPAVDARTWHWRGEAELDLGAAGTLYFSAAVGRGVRLPARAMVRLRAGGEKLRPEALRPARTLKNLLREAAVPPWLRECLPLIYLEGRLAWAAEIGADAAFQVGPEEAGWLISWRRPE
ncbi:MAG: tRNA lysidine(34) synthetase TilS [Gallionellaceae bacterium]|nr:tRNA lysidine(34) synthetase TilS [Gallionellaceae bacterium]